MTLISPTVKVDDVINEETASAVGLPNEANRWDTETLLLQKVIAGDDEAFEEFYIKHHHRVYSICLRMLHNTSTAEDLTQDVFIQLLRKLETYRGESAFTTWLHRLTVNQVLMYFRRREVKFEWTTEDGVVPEAEVNLARLFRPSTDDRIALEQAIDQLPDGYKKVLILHDVEGCEHEEVARILGCSVGTSKSQLHKARIKMQKLLKKKANPRLLTRYIKDPPASVQEPDFMLGFDISQLLTGDYSIEEAFAMADSVFAEEIDY